MPYDLFINDTLRDICQGRSFGLFNGLGDT